MSTNTNTLNAQLEKCAQELQHAIDLAEPLDTKDELLFDLDDLKELHSDMEIICNKSEGIE